MKSLTSMASILVLSASSVFFGAGCMAEAVDAEDIDEQSMIDETAEAVEATADDEENTGESQEAWYGYGFRRFGFGGYGLGGCGGCGIGLGLGYAGYGFGGCGVGCGGCGIGGYGIGGYGYGLGCGGCGIGVGVAGCGW